MIWTILLTYLQELFEVEDVRFDCIGEHQAMIRERKACKQKQTFLTSEMIGVETLEMFRTELAAHFQSSFVGFSQREVMIWRRPRMILLFGLCK